MRQTLLTINHVYLLCGAALYIGVQATLKLFLIPGWHLLKPEMMHASFTVPIKRATTFFIIAVPTWIATSIVMIVTEWGKPTELPAIVSFVGLMVASLTFLAGIKPINNEIASGPTQARLTELLTRWTKLNDVRFAGAVVMWGGLCWYFVQKPGLPGALG